MPNLKNSLGSNQFAFISNSSDDTAVALTRIRLWSFAKMEKQREKFRLIAFDFEKASDKWIITDFLKSLTQDFLSVMPLLIFWQRFGSHNT